MHRPIGVLSSFSVRLLTSAPSCTTYTCSRATVPAAAVAATAVAATAVAATAAAAVAATSPEAAGSTAGCRPRASVTGSAMCTHIPYMIVHIIKQFIAYYIILCSPVLHHSMLYDGLLYHSISYIIVSCITRTIYIRISHVSYVWYKI